MSGRAWARLALDAAAGSWIVALTYSVATWMGYPVPLWLPVLAFALTALARRVSLRLGIAALCLCSAGAAFVGGWPPSWVAALAALASAYRAQTLPRVAPHGALRAQTALGMAVLLLLNVWRLMQGTPPAATLLLPSAVLVAAGLFGLPYVHSLDALGPGLEQAAARPGLRLGGLILVLSAGFGVLVELLRLLTGAGVFSSALAAIFGLVSFVLTPVVRLVFAVFPSALKNRVQTPGKATAPHVPKPAPLTPNFIFWERFTEAAIFLLVVSGIIYFLYRHQTKEREESGQRNALEAGEGAHFERILGPRRGPLDFGSGARGRVRAAVGRHVLRESLRPSQTARQVAQREGWPNEVLDAYERARYRFSAPFEEHEAATFLARFRGWLQERRKKG